ncbi:alanine-zipper protein [Variovorax sp. KK3]|uniref:alanine-zipper protein n=1 Tax=Variovorax sp. KK3 TaxID=1855728 RepID=UPI00097C2E85|nr:hypothetical protein [Variovorax sp. KK3]
MVYHLVGRGPLTCMLAACLVTANGWAQSIPASSADSGRRAAVVIDQAHIYTNINNAWQTGVNAWNYANSAYSYADASYNTAVYASNVANSAQNTANAAYGRGGGFATGVFARHDGGNMISQVACVYGSYGPASGYTPVRTPTGTSFEPFTCPAGSSTFVFSTGTLTEAGNAGGDGGSGGGGGAGG